MSEFVPPMANDQPEFERSMEYYGYDQEINERIMDAELLAKMKKFFDRQINSLAHDKKIMLAPEGYQFRITGPIYLEIEDEGITSQAGNRWRLVDNPSTLTEFRANEIVFDKDRYNERGYYAVQTSFEDGASYRVKLSSQNQVTTIRPIGEKIESRDD